MALINLSMAVFSDGVSDIHASDQGCNQLINMEKKH